MKIRKQMRVNDIYSLQVDYVTVHISYVRSYIIDRDANILSITFYDYSECEYDIRNYDEKVKAIKQINKIIKKFNKKHLEV